MVPSIHSGEDDPSSLQARLAELRRILQGMQRLLVAYSGGVDSTLLAYLAHLELGAGALAVTAVSPTMPAADLAEARDLAHRFQFAHVVLETHELENENYRINTPLRCYWCKQEIFATFNAYAQEHAFPWIADGANLDDTNDYRPGRRAAAECGMRSPLIEARLAKADIRLLARQFGLPNWDKPSAACLASRIPYGTPISIPLLSQVERAEQLLHNLGIRQARLRHHGELARLEVYPSDFVTVLSNRAALLDGLRGLGFTYITLDLAGYQTGSLNQLLKEAHES